MSTPTVAIQTPVGKLDTPVLGGAPPLVVNEDLISGGYNVTHTRSGYCINAGPYDDANAALAVRDAVIDLLNWRQGRLAIQRQVKADKELRQRLIEAGLYVHQPERA